MPKTIVIGTGISAAAYLVSVQQYLKSINQSLGEVYQIGGPDLWHSVHAQHAMGQPQPLLMGNLLESGRESRGFSQTPNPGAHFMEAGRFADIVKHHLDQHSYAQIPDSYVSNITMSGQGYSLLLSGKVRGKVTCDQVIVAMGPGPSRALTVGADEPMEVNVDSFGGYIVGGNQFMAPDWKMPDDKGSEDATIAVYGGSATAAWVVELAAMRKMKVLLWFTRPGTGGNAWAESRFSEAFPAGNRNSAVRADFADVRKVLKLISVESRNDKLELTFTNENAEDVVQVVDILVYALGAEHSLNKGVRALLDPAIQQQLVAFYDRSLAISAKPSLLAIGTENRSLIIVGAAMSSEAGFGRDTLWLQGDPQRQIESNTRGVKLGSYRDISSTLPPAARPTEGIAMVMASVEALNEYMPVTLAPQRVLAMHSTPSHLSTASGNLPRGALNPDGGQDRLHDIAFQWDINFNTSNRTQLAAYIAQTTDLKPFPANLAVALLVHLRTRSGNVLGLSDPQVKLVIAVADYYARELYRLNPHVNWEATRLVYDKLWGPDRHLQVCVESMTKGAPWTQFWWRYQIAC